MSTIVPATHLAAAPIIPLPDSVHLKVVPHGNTFSITAYGKYSQSPSELDVYVQCAPGNCGLPPGKACASRSETELQTILSQNEKAAAPETLFHVDLGSGSSAGGSYTQTRSWPIKPIGIRPFMGTYWVCAYLLVAHTPDGSPTDPPVAHASTHFSLGGGSSLPSSSHAYTITDFRIEPEGASDNLHQHAPRSIRNGQKFSAWFTIRINRDITVKGGHCTIASKEGSKTVDLDSFTFPSGGLALPLRKGQSVSFNSDTLSVQGGKSLSLVGRVTIAGVSESRTTRVQIVG